MSVSKALSIVIAGAVFFGSSAQGQPAQGDLQRARELLKQGKADQSLALVDPIIAQAMLKDAKDPKAICPGVAAAFLQGFMKADHVDVNVSVDNDWCDAMLVKGYALDELKRPAEAAQILETLVGHDPNNTQYLVEYAYAVRASGQLERALELYKQAGRVASKVQDKESAAHWQAAALRGQGYALIDLQRWDDATKAYQRSLKYEPGSELSQKELQYIEQHRPR
jgi:tetratricopeptide (TPR) repeat protein